MIQWSDGRRTFSNRPRAGRVSRMRWNMRAFTLLELLVVVGVISLLVTIIAPSLSGVRELARQAVCSSNLKNIGTAILFYAEDNHECIPPFRASGKPIMMDARKANIGWAEAVDPYIQLDSVDRDTDREVLVGLHACPSKRSNAEEGDPTSPLDAGYGINGYLSSFTSWLANKPQAVFAWVRIDQISRPAEMVLVGASCRMVTLPVLPPPMHAVVARHGGYQRTNAAWADGHVETFSAERIVARKELWDPQWHAGKSYSRGAPTDP